jgi:hypothetical protein
MKSKPWGNAMLFTPHELAFRTQYAELKERVSAAGPLLPGTPGSLALRKGTGYSYWYRVYYPVPGRQAEELVAKEDGPGLDAIRERMASADWAATQVSHLRKLGFQVADKAAGRVLVQLHNEGAFEAGLVLVGTLGYMATLNELGARAVTARTMDIDLARGHPLKLATGQPWLDTLRATGLPFTAVPGMPGMRSPTAAKLPGADGVRVDLLSPGEVAGKPVAVPELSWHAQGLPFYGYLLEDPDRGAMLAGGHCIPVRLPRPARFAVHKLFSAATRRGFPEKAEKDRRQALTVMAALARDEPHALSGAFRAAPQAMLAKIKPRRAPLVRALEEYGEARDILDRALR